MSCFTCSAVLKEPKKCLECQNKFCSDTCLSFHGYFYHNKKDKENVDKNKNSNKPIYNKNYKSPYIVEGIISKYIKYDPIFSLKNFIPEYVNGKPKLIGYGSFGKVFLSMNTINKKYYAIKHMEKKTIYKALHSLDTIYAEIKIQSQIKHPNIVSILYVNETEKNFDIVLEYAKKGNLFFYIQNKKCLTESQSFSLFIQVVNAIYFLHQNNYIHRDIKPENILLFENNVVKLCDFGWCVKIGNRPRSTYCGTTEYMAPEMIDEGLYGVEIDNWSLGVLLYEMLHGYSPFKPHIAVFHDKDVIDNIRYQKSIMFKNNISNECIELIKNLLEKNIEKRYTTDDIFNSKFVKNFEKIKYCFPPQNITDEKNNSLSPKNDKSFGKIKSTKTAKYFYPKSVEDSRQKELIDEYSTECNYIINSKDIQRKNNFIKDNNKINYINEKEMNENNEINSNEKIDLDVDKKDDDDDSIDYLNINKNEDNHKNNFIFFSSKDIKKDNIKKDISKNKNVINRNKSFSQKKYKNTNDIFINKENKTYSNNIINDNDNISFIKSTKTNCNFNNINIILCSNNNINSTQISNNIIIDNNNNNIKKNIFSINNNKTLNTKRKKTNNLLFRNNDPKICYITNSKTIRNSASQLMEKSFLNEENLISHRIKIFNPKKSYIKEINNRTKETPPFIINTNESYVSYMNKKKINELIEYFNLFDNNKKHNILKQRNSFSFILNLDIKKINNNIRYQTIQNKKELMNKNRVKVNDKNILKEKKGNNYFIKKDQKSNKYIEEIIYKYTSENNISDDDIIKTPKKEEDNIKINPKILMDRLKIELNSFNKGFIFENKKTNNI